MADTACAVAQERALVPQNQLVSVPFNGEVVVAAVIDGKPYVPMKPICNNLGLAWNGQFERIQRNEVMSKGIRVIRTPSSGGAQEMLCLPLPMLNGWLFGVDVNRVRVDLRDKLIKYQTECFDVLAQHFMPAVAPVAAPPQPQPAPTTAHEKLNAADMHHLRRMVWLAAHNFHADQSANQGIWYHLRQVTNNPAPNAYGVNHIPLLAAELSRVLAVSQQVRQITDYVEAQAIKRIFRKGEASEKVLAQLAADAARSTKELQDEVEKFPVWMEGELLQFAKRQPALYGCNYPHEQPEFFHSV